MAAGEAESQRTKTDGEVHQAGTRTDAAKNNAAKMRRAPDKTGNRDQEHGAQDGTDGEEADKQSGGTRSRTVQGVVRRGNEKQTSHAEIHHSHTIPKYPRKQERNVAGGQESHHRLPPERNAVAKRSPRGQRHQG